MVGEQRVRVLVVVFAFVARIVLLIVSSAIQEFGQRWVLWDQDVKEISEFVWCSAIVIVGVGQ